MHNNRYLVGVVNYFLPRYAEVLEIGEGYKLPAVIEEDIDEDGEGEILALYKRNKNIYILMLKLFSRKWYVIWNDRTDYKYINRFEITKLIPKYKQIALGGKVGEEKNYKLGLFTWQGERLKNMLGKYITFDKLYIEDIDGVDGVDEIAIWRHKTLEAYDIELYRYKDHQLVLDESLEKNYFKRVVSYYEYLNEIDEEGNIYGKYLEEAKRKCGLEHEMGESEEGPASRDEKDILEVRAVYLENKEVEEDIYLWGKRQEDFITDMKLVATKDGKTKYEIIPIAGDKIYEYQIFVGDFTKRQLDDVWLGVKKNKDSDNMDIYIYSFREGRLRNILDTYDFIANQELGEQQSQAKQNIRIVEIYPVDKNLQDEYEVCYLSAVEKTDKTIEQKITWLRWDGDVFIPYQEYVIEN